jgi:hypothetical protein
MDKQTDVNVELQQVGAYPTKQTMHQQNVPLLDEEPHVPLLDEEPHETPPAKQPSAEDRQG